MHSHDRTLLASLGFQDPDKREPLHDQACAYLAEPQCAAKLVRVVDDLAPASLKRTEWTSGYSERVVRVDDLSYSEARLGKTGARLEVPVTKGEGRYASMIGFLDVSISYAVDGHLVGHTETLQPIPADRRGPGGPWEEMTRKDVDRWVTMRAGEVFVEVKIRPVPIGDLLRQIKLYRMHTSGSPIAATQYPVSKEDVAILRREGIYHVQLGRGFDDWRARTPEPGDSPEI